VPVVPGLAVAGSYYGTRGSLVLAALMHLAFNAALALSAVPLATQLAILAGIYLVFAVVVTIVAGPSSLSRRSERVTGSAPEDET
jgi:hypothetical protein